MANLMDIHQTVARVAEATTSRKLLEKSPMVAVLGLVNRRDSSLIRKKIDPNGRKTHSNDVAIRGY